MVLAPDAKATCLGCMHCALFIGPEGPNHPHPPARTRVCMAEDPPRAVGRWMTIRPDWCPVADRENAVEPSPEGTAGGQGRTAADTSAASDALQLCLLVGFMVLICWCLSGCRDLPLLR